MATSMAILPAFRIGYPFADGTFGYAQPVDGARAGSRTGHQFRPLPVASLPRRPPVRAAAALAYTTVFALVPLAIVVFGVLSAFPVFDRWSDQLSDYVFSNFVPNAARAAEGYLRQFSASAGQLTAAGFIALVVSLLITLNSVEETFNQIWRVGSTRPKLTRFLVYWTVLTLGAMLAAASLAVSARVFALPLFGTQEGRWLAELALRLAPILIEFVCITLMFRVVPHHTVKWRHAIPGAILAAVIPELVKWGIGAYLGSFQSYQKLYGTVAFVPILLLWIYLCWVAVLLGASLSSSMAAFRYQPVELRLPQGMSSMDCFACSAASSMHGRRARAWPMTRSCGWSRC